jgi:tetratricopeptide (TPR) repeat protein
MLVSLSEIVALIGAGRYAELEAAARSAVSVDPSSGLHWKALGVALDAQGKDALAVWQRAVQHSAEDAECHNNLGGALAARRRFAEAAASFRRALELSPEYAEAAANLAGVDLALGHYTAAIAGYRQARRRMALPATALNNLGNALRAVAAYDESEESYRAALALRPDYAEAWNNWGNVAYERGQPAAALERYRRAIELRAAFAEAMSNCGNALRALGRHAEAEASYRRAIEADPAFAAAHANLGEVLREQGAAALAAASCERALALDPSSALAHNALGNANLDLGELERAAACYRRALELKPGFTGAQVNLAMVLRLCGRSDEAAAAGHAALAADPGSAAAHVLLAELCTDRGDFTAAEAHCRRAIDIDPELPEAWAALVYLRRMTPADSEWLVAARRLADAGLPAREETYLRYAIGKYCDDLGDYAEAFAAFRRANELCKSYGSAYDREAAARRVDRLIEAYASPRPPARAEAAARPLFIVGMPRSGTTLAEQILASHPAVAGAGELPFWTDVLASAPALPLHAQPDGAASAARLRAQYLAVLDAASTGALRVVDKMPANFFALGLIHEVLPGARIIHLRRHPWDTCLSIYFQHFKRGHRYANDLDDLVHYFNDYARLMRHWHRVLPAESLLEVPYEELVADPEGWSRRMVEFAGLPWDARCLEFEATPRNVLTASKWQVRQKITHRSVGRWRHYAEFLGPLRALATADEGR